MNWLRIWSFCSVSLLLWSCTSAKPDRVIVAVASSCEHAITEALSSLDDVEVVSGASGQLTTQILNGAPYDVFIPANEMYEQRIKQDFNASRLSYLSENCLAKWESETSSCQKLALADARIAPFGKLAEMYLKNNETCDHAKVIHGTSVSQINQYIMQDAVDVAFTAHSSQVYIQSIKKNGHWTILPDYSVKQYLVQMTTSKNVNKVVELLKSEATKQVLKKNGFTVISD